MAPKAMEMDAQPVLSVRLSCDSIIVGNEQS